MRYEIFMFILTLIMQVDKFKRYTSSKNTNSKNSRIKNTRTKNTRINNTRINNTRIVNSRRDDYRRKKFRSGIIRREKNNSTGKRIHRGKEFQLYGSFTVEAALIFPIIFFAILTMLYLAFYLHDMCRIHDVMDQTLHRAGMSLKHETDFATGAIHYDEINHRGVLYLPFGSTEEEEIQIEQYLNKELKKGLFLTKIININVAVGKWTIGMTVESESKVSLPAAKKYLEPYLHKVIQKKYPIHNPTEVIRISEVVLDTGSKVKGAEKLLDKIKTITNSAD